MTIGEVSNIYNISNDTLRYYEKIGLLGPINKNKSGIRNYNNDDIKQLEFIICMRGADISISSLIKYMKLYKDGPSTLRERKQILIDSLDEVNKQLDYLNIAKDKLLYKIKLYDKDILERKLK